MASSKRTWISIIIASVVIVVLLALVVVGGTAFFIYRHIDTSYTSESTAHQELVATRARFGGQQALIELNSDEQPVVHAEGLKNSRMPEKPLESLRVLAYDDNEGKVVRVSIPFWLLRLFPSKNLSFLTDQGIDLDTRRIRLTLDDLERRGPGLILDTKDRRGSQVIVWTE
jgi:flagellar basal body-associated protein FliL